MKLDEALLLRIAKWEPAVSGWPDDCEEQSLARYQSFVDDLKTLPVSIHNDDGWRFGLTFFGFFLHRSLSEGSFEGLGLAVYLSRFAPIGIYGEERRKWGPGGRNSGFPALDDLYSVSAPDWQPIASDVRRLMKKHSIYLPMAEELSRPISFPLPKLFMNTANQGTSMVFHIIFNDYY